MDIAGSMNITFTADLSRLVGHRPSALYWVLSPGANVGGIGAGRYVSRGLSSLAGGMERRRALAAAAVHDI